MFFRGLKRIAVPTTDPLQVSYTWSSCKSNKWRAQRTLEAENVEAQLKLKEMELRQCDIHADTRRQELNMQEKSIPPKKEFDVSKHVRMVPPFLEAD
jgi:hypothetical protein